jgi:hypothetical protein
MQIPLTAKQPEQFTQKEHTQVRKGGDGETPTEKISVDYIFNFTKQQIHR